MATTATTKVVIQCATAEGTSVNYSYNYINPSAQDADIVALASGIVANGSIFEKVPVLLKTIKMVTTTTEDIDPDA